MATISKLAEIWGVDDTDAREILHELNIPLESNYLASLTHCGVVDDGSNNKFHGHNGYWVAAVDYEGYDCLACYVTNGNSVEGELDENMARDMGLDWGPIEKMFKWLEIME